MTGRMGPMVGILTRMPRVGRGKSRLAVAVGPESAAALSGAFLLDVAYELRSDDRWACALFIDPPEACEAAVALTGIADARPQSSGSIGTRLAAAAASFAAGGACAAVLVGSDAPHLEAEDVAHALGMLERHDIVFGPATDGGYYLVAMGPAVLDAPGALFGDAIPWSTSTVLLESERVARSLGWSVSHLRPLTDVDTVDDLADVRRELAHRPVAAAHTRDALRALDAQPTLELAETRA